MGNKLANRGKNINEILDPNNAPADARFNALRRTMLVSKLNTGRCTTPQELEQRFNNLFELAYQEGFVPVVEHLAICSGFDRRSIWDIETGVSHKGDGMSDVVKNAKALIAAMDADLASNNEMNANVYKFRAMNYYGMHEKQEIEVKPITGNEIPENTQEILNSIPQLKENND